MDPQDAADRLAALSAEIALRYGVGGGFPQQIKRIRRTLPRYERHRAEELVRVAAALEAGVLKNRIDRGHFERAETALQMHLDTLDQSDRRKSYALDLITTLLINLTLATGLLVLLWIFVTG